MRRIFLCSIIVLLTFGFSVTDATAGRFGGGRSFGMMRPHPIFSQSRTKSTAYSSASNRVGANTQNRSKWRGAFTGFLVGGLLASLFMGHGFGSAFISWLCIGLFVFMATQMIQRRKQQKES